MAQDRPDIVVFPPLAAGTFLLAAGALQAVVPLGYLPAAGTPWILVPGVALIVAAAVLAGTGARSFRRAGTNVDPRRPALKVVTAGPYRLTRNPMYLGMVGLLAGLGLALSLDWALPLSAGLWALLHFGVVLREEAYLSTKFGDEYRALVSRTRRWL